MKYLSSLLLIFFTSFSFAQNPTYEQTVDFIKTNVVGRMLYEGALDSYQRETGHKLTKIEIQNDGRIKLVADQQNGRHDFEIVFNIFDLKSSIDYPDGIRAYKFLVHFQGLNVSSGYGITFATDADAQRVARAFRHLKTMCSKGGGLFDEPIQSQKRPTLSKSETISYIENLLNRQPAVTSHINDTKYKEKTQQERTQTINNNLLKFKTNETTTYYEGTTQYQYSEFEEETYILNAPIKNISLFTPDGTSKNGLERYYYWIKIEFTPYLEVSTKSRKCDFYKEGTTSSFNLADTKESCRSKSWNSSVVDYSDIKIFINNESDANKLKKAFEHLAALINEEKNAEKENDPFGN